jgi:23S rRNA (adenine2030-N6)-methyltransferase
MNYRHAYHAGNHADVLKHVVLARLLEHMKKKDKPFRVIDAHAGVGLYDLAGTEAGKTGEWEGGIGKLAEPFAPQAEALLAPYRAVIAALNPGGTLRHYPGSPELALRLMRTQDRLIANELHPLDAIALERQYLHDQRCDVTAMDAETCLKAKLPPPERRGLILVDPPYEVKTEAEKTVRMLAHGLRRFLQGVFVVWYPLKADATAETVLSGIRDIGLPGCLRVELRVREAFSAGGLAGSGIAILNAPWKLDEELKILVPALAQRLGLGDWGRSEVAWINKPV